MICSVPSEAALIEAQVLCTQNGIREYLFIESDLGDQPTALATEPISGDKRRAFRKFPLWKPQDDQGKKNEQNKKYEKVA